MCFSQNGRSPIGRHVATSEAASSFTLSDTNPLSHHRSRPHKTTNAVPLNQAHTNAPSPEPLASFCTTHHALYPTQPHTPLWAHGLSQQTRVQNPGVTAAGLATPLAFIAHPGIDPQRPACPIGLRRGLSRDRADLTITNILSQIQNILSILIHAKSMIEPRTQQKTQPKVGKITPNHRPQRANRCWCFRCHVTSTAACFLTLLTG